MKKLGLLLDSVSLMPTIWKGEPIPINKPNKLSVMLHLMFKEIKSEFSLNGVQIREVDVDHLLMRCLQSGEYRFLDTRCCETSRETIPTTQFNCCNVAFSCTNDAPQLT